MDIAITPTGNPTVDTLLAFAKMAVYPGAVATIAATGYGIRRMWTR